MTREQKLEQELAELRKARNILRDRVDDAGKKSEKEKAQLYDDAVALIRGCVDEAVAGVNWDRTRSAHVLFGKALKMVLGEDGCEALGNL